MDIKEIAELYNIGAGDVGVFILVIMSIIQISPIKINPWSWIAKKIGKAINGDLIEKVDKLVKNFEQSKALSSRAHILRFNDELLQNQRHSKEYFDQILEDIDDYNNYCKAHEEFKNERVVMSIENIRRCYRQCMEDRDFL